jgi:hypothetical protein
MKIAIAGSSGLIGQALVAKLRTDGHEVIRFVRRPSIALGEITWDPSTLKVEVTPQLEGLDALINLCGVGIGDKRWTASRKKEILRSRVNATKTLVELLAALDTPPAVFLSASAIGIYGDRGSETLTESSARGTGFLADVCDDWETAASNNIARTVLLRTGIVLDPHGGALKKQLPLFRAGLGGNLGNGQQWFSWISLHDQIEAMVHLIEHPELDGPVNLTAPTPVTNAEFTKTLARVLHRPHLFAVPEFALGLALGKDLATEALTASQRVVPNKLTTVDHFAFKHVTLENALSDLLATNTSR